MGGCVAALCGVTGPSSAGLLGGAGLWVRRCLLAQSLPQVCGLPAGLHPESLLPPRWHLRAIGLRVSQACLSLSWHHFLNFTLTLN